MEEESLILEQKKYPLVSLADILTIIMNETGNYPCNKCQYQGSSQRNTKRHELNVHEVIKYNCEQCGYEQGI